MLNNTKFLLCLLVAGLCFMMIGSAMGAKRSLPLVFFGKDISINGPLVVFSDNMQVAHANMDTGGYIKQTNTDAFHTIEVNMVDIDVVLAQAGYYGFEIDYPSDRKMGWEIKNGRLIIEDKTHTDSSVNFSLFSGFSYSNGGGGKVTVYTNGDEMDTININTVSGGISVDNHTAKVINLNSVSGNVNTKSSGADTINVKTVSGNFNAHDGWGKNIKFNSVSGKISFQTNDSLDDYSISVSSVSGSAYINGNRVGKNEYQRSGKKNDISVSTISGNVDLDLK